MDRSFDSPALAPPMPKVRHVAPTAPIDWLRIGAGDLHRDLRTSLRAGLAVALCGWLLMAVSWRMPHVAPALLGGFLLVAPFAAIAVYAARRNWRDNAASIALFGLLLAFALLAWERIAAVVFALFYRGEPLQLATLATTLLFSGQHVPMLLTLGSAGAIVAAAVFALSVVTVPLLLDRPVDIVTAIVTSVRCCLRNPAAMLVWALLIAVVTAIGLATFMIGLVLVFPWLAHASWRAYEEMVAFDT